MWWSTSELTVRLAPLNRFKLSSKYFTDRSKAVLLLWMFYVFLSCVCYAFVRVCLYVPCGHLLGKGWSLGSHLWCPTVSFTFSLVSCVRCGTWLYRFLIFAPLLTLNITTDINEMNRFSFKQTSLFDYVPVNISSNVWTFTRINLSQTWCSMLSSFI